MEEPVNCEGLELVLLADSYLLSVEKSGRDIVFRMEFTLSTSGLGNMIPGVIIFKNVMKDEWYNQSEEPVTLEHLLLNAFRYSSGPSEDGSHELADMGCIESIRFENDRWQIRGDWGHCHLWTDQVPRTYSATLI